MRQKNYFWGIILILIGVGAILNNIFNIHFFTISQLWPIFVLIPGLSFEAGYFSRGRDPGLLVPGIAINLSIKRLKYTTISKQFSSWK
jgi:hypothetical protein